MDAIVSFVDDLEINESANQLDMHLLQRAGLAGPCPFLETVDYSATHWTVRAIGSGTFTFLVTEPNENGENEVIGTITYGVLINAIHRQNCNQGQTILISCGSI
jgi:hypothetical protein